MAEPSRIYDDQEPEKPLSARERAKKRWGTGKTSDNTNDAGSPGSEDQGSGQADDTDTSSSDKSAMSPEDIFEAENGNNPKEELFPDSESKPLGLYNNDKADKESSHRQALKLLLKNKKFVAGGGIFFATITIFLAMFNMLSFEAIHIRENMLGNSNRLVNYTLETRRAKNFGRVIRQMHRDTATTRIKPGKMKAKLESKGFKVEFDADGKLNNLEYAPEGKPGRRFNIDEPDLRKATRDFFSDGTIGREISRQFDAATGTRSVTWRGKMARKLYGNMKISLKNIFKKPISDTNEDGSKKNPMTESLKSGEKGDEITFDETNKKPAEEFTDPDPDNDDVSAAQEDIDEARTGWEEIDEGKRIIAEAGDDLADPSDALGINPDSVDELASPSFLKRILNKDLTPTKITSLFSEMRTKIGSRMASRIDDVAQKGARFISPVEVARVGCRVRGSINFIGSVRNIYISMQLAKFAVRFLVASDNQKAGLIKSDGIKIVMDYLNAPNPATGRSGIQSGGMQNVVFGNKDAMPSVSNLSRYTATPAPTGVLKSIDGFVSTLPLINSTTACKFSNNGLVQAVGFGVGVIAGFFSGGGVTAGQVVAGVSMSVAEELVFMIGTPLIIQAVTNSVINGFENGEMGGDALASGWGALRGMNAGANGLRPLSKESAISLRNEVDEYDRYNRSQESIFARYLDFNNTYSLSSKMALSFSSSLNNFRAPLTKSGLLGINFANLLPKNTSLESVLAAEDTPCEDSQANMLKVETDVFCNIEMAYSPDLDTDQTEQLLLREGMIDTEGNIVAEFDSDDTPNDLEDYIAYCHAGRPGLLYTPKADQNGTENPADDTCAIDGAPLESDVVGKNLRFSDYFGYWVDRENFAEDINDEFDSTGAQTTAPTTPVVTQPTAEYIGNTANVPCVSGANDKGEVDGYNQGQPYRIRICEIPNFASSSSDDGGYARVNSTVSSQWLSIANKARSDGIRLVASSSFRTMERQEYFWNCYHTGSCNNGNLAARPGFSNHQMGLAVDIDIVEGATDPKLTTCAASPSTYPTYYWLSTNAPSFGITAKVDSECWHWSIGGR